jgi:hypothetical protein
MNRNCEGDWFRVPGYSARTARRRNELGGASLSAAHSGCRCADCLRVSVRNQHTPGPPSAGSPVWQRCWQRYGQPGLAQSESDCDTWKARSRAKILDGTVVLVRLEKKSTRISLLIALGVRRTASRCCSRSRTWTTKPKPPRGHFSKIASNVDRGPRNSSSPMAL